MVKKGNRIEERRVIIRENGVLIPGHVNVLVVYPWNFYIQSKKIKLETEIRYDKFKFFTVETEHKIII